MRAGWHAGSESIVRIMLYGRVSGSHITGDVEFGDRGLGTWSADRVE